MRLGLSIDNNKVIWLGQLREELISSLEKNNMEFKIMFDKVNKERNIKETIISIPQQAIELSLEDDILKYIKTKASEYTILNDVDTSQSNSKRVESILEATRRYFSVNEINICDLNMSNFDIRVIIEDSEYKYRIHIMTTQKGESFIYTMKII